MKDIMTISSERLRKAIILRAFNRRKNTDHTFYDQFYGISYKEKSDGKQYIDFSDLKSYLNFNQSHPSILELSRNNSNRIELEDFLYFLQYGQLKKLIVVSNKDLAKTSNPDNAARYNSISSHINTANIDNQPKASSTNHSNDSDIITVIIDLNLGTSVEKMEDNRNSDDDNNKKNVADNKKTTNSSSSSSSGIDNSSSLNDTKINNTSLELVRSSNSNEPVNDGIKNVWRKSEVVKQERIVSYITIDALGIKQELCEKETTQTEVLHMEYRETGEFAHRETTTVHQQETFNNEVVTESDGKEEYVHLKSIDNEVEYVESNMPKKTPRPQEGDDGGEGEYFGEGNTSSRKGGGGEDGRGGGEGGIDESYNANSSFLGGSSINRISPPLSPSQQQEYYHSQQQRHHHHNQHSGSNRQSHDGSFYSSSDTHNNNNDHTNNSNHRHHQHHSPNSNSPGSNTLNNTDIIGTMDEPSVVYHNSEEYSDLFHSSANSPINSNNNNNNSSNINNSSNNNNNSNNNNSNRTTKEFNYGKKKTDDDILPSLQQEQQHRQQEEQEEQDIFQDEPVKSQDPNKSKNARQKKFESMDNSMNNNSGVTNNRGITNSGGLVQSDTEDAAYIPPLKLAENTQVGITTQLPSLSSSEIDSTTRKNLFQNDDTSSSLSSSSPASESVPIKSTNNIATNAHNDNHDDFSDTPTSTKPVTVEADFTDID